MAAIGYQLGGERVILFSGNNAAAGSLIRASSREPAVLTLIETFRRTVARVAASYWMGRVSSSANPADAPRSNRELPLKPGVQGELAPRQQALQWPQSPQQPVLALGSSRKKATRCETMLSSVARHRLSYAGAERAQLCSLAGGADGDKPFSFASGSRPAGARCVGLTDLIQPHVVSTDGCNLWVYFHHQNQAAKHAGCVLRGR